MLTVVETPEFISAAAHVWTEVERLEFIDWIAEHPLSGDVIPGTSGLRKVRWTRDRQGKRGGARVIYFVKLLDGKLVLLFVYSKAKFDNVRPEFLCRLKERYEALSR